MTFRLTYVERREPETSSFERVFQRIGTKLREKGITVGFEKLPYPNNALGMLKNAAFYRPSESDVYHVTGQVHYVALFLPRAKTVLTIHDLGVLRVRSGLRRYLIRKLLFDFPARKVKYLTVSSESTKQDLLKLTKCHPHKIRVIELPLPRELKGSPKPIKRERPRILQIGTATHKNLRTVIEALNGMDCTLRIIGALQSCDLEQLRINKIEFTNAVNLSDEQMIEEYEQADVVAFCSTFEGFGLPIIEAQAMCVPLVTSDRSPMKEVAGDGAILVDPHSPKSIRGAVETIIEDDDLRETLISRGRANVKRFSSQRIAEQFAQLYTEVVRNSRPGTA